MAVEFPTPFLTDPTGHEHQLRGEVASRQVEGAHVGLTQNMGGTGASTVIHILARS